MAIIWFATVEGERWRGWRDGYYYKNWVNSWKVSYLTCSSNTVLIGKPMCHLVTFTCRQRDWYCLWKETQTRASVSLLVEVPRESQCAASAECSVGNLLWLTFAMLISDDIQWVTRAHFTLLTQFHSISCLSTTSLRMFFFFFHLYGVRPQHHILPGISTTVYQYTLIFVSFIFLSSPCTLRL